jgi:hypothetical protein
MMNALNQLSTYSTQVPTEHTESETKSEADNNSEEANETERKKATQDGKRDIKTEIDSSATNEYRREINSLAYKKATNMTKPVATTLPEEFKIVQRIPSNPFVDLPTVPSQLPEFKRGDRYTRERMDKIPVNEDDFLWPEEVKMEDYLIREHQSTFAWNENEREQFSEDYFDPVPIPTMEHIPWGSGNILIPPGIYDRVAEIIKHKIDPGIFEPSNSSYRSRWFSVRSDDNHSNSHQRYRPIIVIMDGGFPDPMTDNVLTREVHGKQMLVGYLDQEVTVL